MANKALVVIDVQNDMFHEGNVVYNGNQLLKKLKSLIAQAREKKIPVFYVQHNEPSGWSLEYGKKEWEIHAEIEPHEKDIIIHKKTPDSFLNTTLEDELKKQHIDHLYLTGIQTEVCVDTTCRSAFSRGYKLTLISDTHSTWDTNELTAAQIIHHHNRVLQWFAKVESSEEINF